MADVPLFISNYGGFLSQVPTWVKRGVARRAKCGELTIVSAVCPDYERCDGSFTYRSLGGGLPYTAGKHLIVMVEVLKVLQAHDVRLNYHITLADTEFDLPLVVEHMTNGDQIKFMDLCQSSCHELVSAAKQQSLPLGICGRFTSVFPDWFANYQRALLELRKEVQESGSARYDLELNASRRIKLYQAMAGREVDLSYCREMVLRQNAQYMAWGECAEAKFGPALVMVNHSTPNLSWVNHPFTRAGRERIPILQLSITTVPE